jgi:LysM repeat protein
MFRNMSRLGALLLLAGWVGAAAMPLWGAQEETVRAAADRESAEERYRLLNSAVEDLLASQMDLRRRLSQLSDTVNRLASEARTRPSDSTFVSRAEFEKLVEAVRQIDAKREADRKQILEELDNLSKSVNASIKELIRRPAAVEPAKPHRADPRPEPPSDVPANVPSEGVYHEVKKGNTVSSIVTAYNEEFRKQGYRTSLSLVLQANPGLKPESIVPGQKIFIPRAKLENR